MNDDLLRPDAREARQDEQVCRGLGSPPPRTPDHRLICDDPWCPAYPRLHTLEDDKR